MDLYLNKPVAFSVMAKPVGPVCNLNCTYCYYLEKEKLFPRQSIFKMSDEVLERYIQNYIESQQVPEVLFGWQGGEPTLAGIPFFKKAVQLQAKYAGNKIIRNAFQTNGTRIDDEWCRFFKENNFLIGVSIDGPEEIHDYHRKYKNDLPTFSLVMKGIERLKRYGVDFNTLTVVNRHNSKYPVEIYRFLKQIGSRYLQFIPIVERQTRGSDNYGLSLVSPDYQGLAKVSEWSVLPEDYGEFLVNVFDEWVRCDVGKVFIQLFDATLANWVGADPGLCVLAETCGDAMVIEHNGDVYSCDHFVFPEHKIGNVMKESLVLMARGSKQNNFGTGKSEKLPDYCLNCEYLFTCHGECPKYRFTKTPDGEDGLNYLCKGYKRFFSHVHPYMQFMADELLAKRPPANVMNCIREKTI